MTVSIRILIADDHLIVRQGLRLILETEEGFELAGEAADGAEALRLCHDLHPDVVLMDLRMPGMDGLSAIERLQAELPEIAVVILTTFNEDDLLLRGLRAGARGYLLKDVDRQTLFNTIRAAARGETLLNPALLSRLLTRVESAHEANTPAAALELTERERQVLQLIAEGLTSMQIGDRLHIAASTVDVHRRNLMRKLDLHNVADLTRYAITQGISPTRQALDGGLPN